MSDRRFSTNLHGRSAGQNALPMEYINRMLDRYSRMPSRPRPRHFSSPPAPPAVSPQNSPPKQYISKAHRHHKRKTHKHKMTSFTGPWADDLDALKRAVQSVPDQYKSSFSSASKDVLEKVCDPNVLHVWETDSDIDNLLQLTSVIAKLCNLGTRKDKGVNASNGSMIIIAEGKSGRNNFARICELVEHLTCASGKKHLDGTVAAFGSIVVVRGWNNSVRSDNAGKEVGSTVKRINVAIERVFKMSNTVRNKIVWHHGPVVHFLLTWINGTSSNLRNALYAITVTGSLELTDSVKPSFTGRSNTLPDLTCLENYAKKLDIPVLFLDNSSQLISFQHLPTCMYYHGCYINTFLPASLSRPHLLKAQDELVTFAFQILGASKSKYSDSIVKAVKSHLDASTARTWAKKCIDPHSYEKSKCRAAGKGEKIHYAVQLADSPFSLFASPSHQTLPAFARLAVGPAANETMSSYTAAPVSISFSSSRLRPSNPAVFHILLPAHTQDLSQIIDAIQGIMMAVLICVWQEKGNPAFGAEEKSMWRAVSGACLWALDEAKSAMPKSVDAKVKFVRGRLSRGTWACVMNDGIGGEGGGNVTGYNDISDAARANQETAKTYGNPADSSFPHPAQYQSAIQQQQQYPPPPYDPFTQQSPNIPFPHYQHHQQGLAAPPNSPGAQFPPHRFTQQMYAPHRQGLGLGQGQGYAPPRIVDAAFSHNMAGAGGRCTGPPPPVHRRRSGGERGGYM